MDEHTKKVLDGLFEQAARSKTQADEQARKAQEAREQFSAQWAALEQDVIRPTLQEYVLYLAERGVSAEVRAHSKWSGGQPNIGLFFYGVERPHTRHDEYPAVIFYPDAGRQHVGLHTGTLGPNRGGGSAGPRGTFAIGDVTPALIRTVIFDWLKELIR